MPSICFNDTPPAGAVLPFVANANGYQFILCSCNDPSGNPLLANSFYTNHTNFGMAAVKFKPAKRGRSQYPATASPTLTAASRSSMFCSLSAQYSTSTSNLWRT